VFEPFGQVVTVEVNVREGIGLVLSIVHQLLELENGRICLNSRATAEPSLLLRFRWVGL
jgi:signal transduction histidine kinase